MHWQYKKKPDLSQFGFVYLITNTKTGKAYIGCKQYYTYKKYVKTGRFTIFFQSK